MEVSKGLKVCDEDKSPGEGKSTAADVKACGIKFENGILT